MAKIIKDMVVAKLLGKKEILIEKLKKVYGLDDNHPSIKDFKEYYDDDTLNKRRYIIFEDYNIEDGFYSRDYDAPDDEKFDEFVAEELQDDYYSDSDKTRHIVSDCAIIDLKTLEIYNIERQIKFKITKVR